MTPDQIVEVLESSHDEQQPALILCASEATRQQVMRELLAARLSWAGLRVQTLNSAARTLASNSLHPEEKLESLPEDHVWFERLQNRPLLCQQLAEHVGVLHRMKAVGLSIDGASDSLRSLVDAEWAVPEDLSGWSALMATKGPVFGVGFAGGDVGTGCGRLGAVEAHVLDTLGIERVVPGTVDSIDTIKVTDVASEARSAAALLQGSSDGLVLVADAETGERVAATMRRNGMSVAEDGGAALKNHALVSLLRRLVPCFESQGAESISATDLIDYLIHPALSRRSIKRGTQRQEEQDEEGVDRSSVRDVRTLLQGARRYHATVAEWVALVDAQLPIAQNEADQEADEDKKARLQRYVGTIVVVQGHLQALAEHLATGTLGGLGKLLSMRRLSHPGDRLGYAIIGALGGRSMVVANRENLDLALSGSTSGVRVGNGTSVLRYEEYDGRSSTRLVLLDVHHKGLGQASTVSPLLQVNDYECLGLPVPTVAVSERMALAQWAASRASSVCAVVTEVDATGRRVVPPVQLDLNVLEAEGLLGGIDPARYGHALPLPETKQRTIFVEEAAGTSGSLSRAQQVAAEWVRAGFRESSISVPTLSEDPQTLLDYIALYDVRPTDLRPWLGEAGAAKGSADGLPPNFGLSATSMETFTNCMYVAWVERVLRIREPETLEEDVNARELGTATHAVLESYVKTRNFQLVVPSVDVVNSRQRLVDHCISNTETEVKQARERWESQQETPAVEAARHGLTQRWQQHWSQYASKRVLSPEEAADQLRSQLAKNLGQELAQEVVAEMCPALAKGPTEDVARLFVQCLTAEPSLDGLRDRMPDALEQKGVAQKNRPIVMDALNAEPPESLEQLIEEAVEVWQPPAHPDGDGLLLDAEIAFGVDAEQTLSLGRAPVAVRGSIDALVEWKTTQNNPTLEVLDFKTGGTKSGGNHQQVREWHTKPQLTFYALSIRDGLIPKSKGLGVSKVGYDMVKLGKHKPIPVDANFLADAQRLYGALLDRARDGDFVPIPHPQWSPFPGGHQSDIFDALRIRPDGLPDHAEEEEDES